MRRIVSFGPAFVVLTCAVVVLFAVPSAIRAITAARTRATVTLAQQRLDQDDVLVRLNAAVRDIALSVEPSVVHVDVGGRREGRASSGSGWVWDDAGHLVTNAHVVAGADRISVQFHDGQTSRATLVGMDPLSDIAVLRVEPGPHLVPARRAVGERVFKGDRVFAFGSPFGFKFSMSEGIVSGLGRSARTAMGFAGFSNFIQTDAAVNPGNSGGPLVDVRGRLVGMNVAIATAQDTRGSTEGQSAGISFAIPLAMIESRVPQLIAGGPVLSGYLGITFSAENIPGGSLRRGVEITALAENGPGRAAGLAVGDLITSIDGTTITGPEVLRGVISASSPGQDVELIVLRAGESLTLRVTLGEYPRAARSAELQSELFREFGLSLRDVREGAVIWDVLEDTPASVCGLERGLILFSVEGARVADAAEAASALLAQGLLAGKPVSVRVRASDGQERDLVLRSAPD
ncbi:MAG: hypothetical protein HBSAPP03_04390 [Phycisphaerae bacterium]|nr:MAG: hypothetical protein HBSAPP03_04390 [Phycisphaerae bacterium]